MSIAIPKLHVTVPLIVDAISNAGRLDPSLDTLANTSWITLETLAQRRHSQKMVRSISTTGCTVEALLVPYKICDVSLRSHHASQNMVFVHCMPGFM